MVSTIKPSLTSQRGKDGKRSSFRDIVVGVLIGAAISHMFHQEQWTNASMPTSPPTSTSVSAASTVTCPPVKECNCPIPEATPIKPAAAETVPTAVKSFYDIGNKFSTDKVQAPETLPRCLTDEKTCTRPGCVNERCRSWGHYYHTMYQNRLAPYSIDGQDPFQFLEVGFFKGAGYQTYREFLSDTAEVHSMEIACGPEGPESEGKWPFGNHANQNANYQQYVDEKRLHCGNAASPEFLNRIWTTEMHRPDAPPLKVVVDDGSHVSWHMAQSVFFWFPRIEPGGILIVEDIQPIYAANLFRTQFLPQMNSDLHFCGDPKEGADEPCFPLLQKMLHSIHCEMHICIFERNQEPAIPDLPLSDSTLPENALNASKCTSIGKSFGSNLPSQFFK